MQHTAAAPATAAAAAATDQMLLNLGSAGVDAGVGVGVGAVQLPLDLGEDWIDELMLNFGSDETASTVEFADLPSINEEGIALPSFEELMADSIAAHS